MKFEIGDKVRMYSWQTASGIMRALDKGDKDFVFGISKESWNKWRNADDLTIDSISANDFNSTLERYRIRSESLDGKFDLLWVVPAMCMYKKQERKKK